MRHTPIDTLNTIAQIIYDKKGSNILAINVEGLSSITDYLIIAEGDVERHVSAIARAIIEVLEERGGPKLIGSEGLKSGDWVVLDYGDIMVHLFKPHLRELYSLERLWEDSRLVDLQINFSKKAAGDLK